jgi:hypothetical protein
VNMSRGAGTALGVAVAGALYTASAGGGLSLAMGVLGGAGLLTAAWLRVHTAP